MSSIIIPEFVRLLIGNNNNFVHSYSGSTKRCLKKKCITTGDHDSDCRRHVKQNAEIFSESI